MANATLLSTFVVLTQTIAMVQNPDVAPKIEVQNDNYVKRKGGVITLTVHPDVEIGPVKRMNAVNNGPNCSRTRTIRRATISRLPTGFCIPSATPVPR